MKISQRLTRAGLTFVLLGSVAAVMPHNDAAQASTQSCTNGNHYRLTSDASGLNDTSLGTVAKNTSQSFYVFSSPDGGTGTYTAYAPIGFAASASYPGSGSGNTYIGTTSNTSGSNQIASISAVVPGGTLVETFTITP